MKILFLDIDGVLNSHKSDWSIKGTDTIDPINIEQLNILLNKFNDLYVVVSSSWRKHHYLAWIVWHLIEHGLNINYSDRFIDKTPNLFKPRHYEIQSFLDEGPRGDDITHFAIIDDSSDAEIFGHFVKTSMEDGWTAQHTTELIKILS